MIFYGVIKFLSKVFYDVFYPHKIYGKENIPKDTNCILVSNHFAKIDAVVTATLFKGRPRLMGKKELVKNKFSAKFFKYLGIIPVDRENADIGAIKQCFTALKNGENLIIFPEGTRNKNDRELMEIKGGAGVIAYRSGVKVVPFVMYSRFRMFHKNYAYVGEPFDYSELKGQRLDSPLEECLKEKMTVKLKECQEKLDEIVKAK